MKKFLLLFCCGLLVTGCVRGMYEEDDGKLPPKFSVNEARRYFEKSPRALALPAMLHGEKGGAQSVAAARIALMPNWGEASLYPAGDMDVVDVPLRSNIGFSLQCQDKQPNGTTKHYELNRIDTRLTITTSPEAGVQMFIMTMIPNWHGLFNWATETRFMHPPTIFRGWCLSTIWMGTRSTLCHKESTPELNIC